MKPASILHHSNPDYTNSCGIKSAHSTTNPADVTCKRCLKAMAAREAQVDAQQQHLGEVREFAVMMGEQADRVDAALDKPAKPATIHLHDSERSEYGTWCRIPGQHTTDPNAVTCKVCRAHIDGKAPLNAVPERVKQARKAFRSFVARVAYMVFMDRDCSGDNGINWSLSHTNMAGDQYEVGRSNTTGYRVMCNASIVTTDLGGDIKQWMEDNWSCGEEK